MNHTRAAFLRTVYRLVNARAPEERAAAAAEAQAALQTFVESGEFLDAEPETEAVTAKTRADLGGVEPPVAEFTDTELRELNQLLPWAAMTADTKGRVIGAPWSNEKRSVVHPLIESRQIAFDREYPLKGKHVAEFGCLEGVQTLGLLLLGARVTGLDGRMENVLKTMARVWAYGRECDVRLWDFERPAPAHIPEAWDVAYHIGVLYHLADPIGHLEEVLGRTRDAFLLDTHVALDEAETKNSFSAGGRQFRYRFKREPHADSSPFAGMRDHAKYLLAEELADYVASKGFRDVRMISDRVERNGRRITLWAFR